MNARSDITRERVQQLRDSGMTYEAIASTLKCHYSVITRRLSTTPPRVSKQKYGNSKHLRCRDFIRMYWGDGLTVREIGKLLGDDPSVVHRYMRRCGCPTKSSKDTNRQLSTRIRKSASRRQIPVSEWVDFSIPPSIRFRYGKGYIPWRKKVVARDKCCLFCGGTEKLVAHHIIPLRDAPELRIDLDNGATLCDECHRAIHSKEHLYIPFLKHRVNRASTEE